MAEEETSKNSLADSLRSSLTSERIPKLQSLQQKLQQHGAYIHIVKLSLIVQAESEESLQGILLLLFSTYPAYKDRPSRYAVQDCLRALFEISPETLSSLASLIRAEATRPGHAPSNVFVLIEWCSLAIGWCGTNLPSWERHGADLTTADALLLELLASSNAKSSLKRSALVVNRRAFRKVFSTSGLAEPVLQQVVAQLTGKNDLGNRSAILLGIIASVCARISSIRKAFEEKKDRFYTFWAREVIASKAAVPKHIANSFHGFFSSFTTLEDFQTYLLPAFEKALLRAPEVVLNDVMAPVFLSLAPDIDLSNVLLNNLLKPLLANIKSSNADIRDGALATFGALLRHCHDPPVLLSISNEILMPMVSGKVPSAEQRVYLSRMLSSLPTTKNPQRASEGLVSIVTKEPNEAAACAEAIALTDNVDLTAEDEPAKFGELLAAVIKGLSDKRPGLQKMWILQTGNMLWKIKLESPSLSSRKFVEAIAPKLIELSTEAMANLIPATQSGVMISAYILTSLQDLLDASIESAVLRSQLQKLKIRVQALTAQPKPSFLINSKVYSKLTSKEDLRWALRGLVAVTEVLVDIKSQAALAWMQSMLYLATSTAIPYAVRRETNDSLTTIYGQNPDSLARLVVRGVWARYDQFAAKISSDGDATPSESDMLRNVIRSICVPPGKSELHARKKIVMDQLIDMLVLCRPEIISRVSWIDLCLRMGQDPGELVNLRASSCLGRVNAILEPGNLSYQWPQVMEAAYNTYAELAFVAPEIMVPLLIEQMRDDLRVELLQAFDPVDFAIARTPEGTAFVDVLNAKGPTAPSRGTADYNTLKWEEDVRAQLAQKKGLPKKLTSEEQAKVNAQLSKEADVRNRVSSLERRLRRGVGLIQGLATGPPSNAELWIGPAIKALLDVIRAGASHVLGDSAASAYLSCSNVVSSRVGHLRYFIGVATLRAIGGASHMAPNLTEEPLPSRSASYVNSGLTLTELITRTLYRLRLGGEQRPFDVVSLNYMIPLICLVLQDSRPQQAGEIADEQVALALEFLSFHADLFSSSHLPRGVMMELLIESMQRYSQHFKIIKDCLLDFCRAIGPTATTTEIAILLQGIIAPQVAVRTAVSQAVRSEIDLTVFDFSEEIWIASCDDSEENAGLGEAIWLENALDIEADDLLKLMPHLGAKDKSLRRAAAKALAKGVARHPSSFAHILRKLQEEYREKAKPRTAERDQYGMIKKGDLSDPWEARSGIALAFKELAVVWEIGELVPFVDFLIQANALGDRQLSVRDEMIECATTLLALHGAERLEDLMRRFEEALETTGKDALSDALSEAVVILYGALGRHLANGDDRVPKVVDKLLQTLSTPSETVQYAVAECLPPLVRTSTSKTSEYIQRILDDVFQSKTYARRRGAAYGLAGIVKGKGILALREHRIMSALRAAVENKKDVNCRQGALFAYELLSLILERSFEPYVIQIVPQLLASFGDANANVREACLDAAKACFSRLSSYGVQQILPTLLEGLDEPQWRSKKGACDLLGAMAYLDPQQLALSLPDIIPPLTNVLNDSHKEVRAAANRSLQRFGDVISNPEIKALVKPILKALGDPAFTEEALDALIKVSFAHYLDSPSLALVVRILERGLGERSGTKRKAAQMIGSLAYLTERRDLVSHLPKLVAGLRLSAVDPVPTTRATSSKALGSLVEKLGEDALPDLIPSLMTTLKSDTGAGDRLGSAQALSEVLAGLGTERLEQTLPTILQNVASSKAAVREGFMSLFIYLPACFGNSFAAYLNRIVPPILAGLADDVEAIRETALRAGRLLVKNFATKALDLLLPELDRGLADDSHRIRLSSVELVGDLLFNLTGVSGNPEHDDDGTGAVEAGQSLLEVLGEERRNKILSSLYICRSDTSGLVRTAAIHVWKALVATPRTLKELVPTLTHVLIRRLASPNMEQKVIAGNALSELIRKSGEGVLASLLPTLEASLQSSTDVDAKQGICIALREIISSASPEILEDYEKTLVAVVRVAIVDTNEEVRDTAAEAFDSLQHILGKRAVDSVLPYLLTLLRDEDEKDHALAGILTLLNDTARSNVILPSLVPTLLASPISSFNAKAIASLAAVAGAAMSRRLLVIFNTLMDNIVACTDDALRHDLEASFDTVFATVDEFDGLNTAMSVVLQLVKHEDHRRRSNAAMRLSQFFQDTEVDYSRYNPDLIRVLLLSFDDRDSEVVISAWTALSELTKRLRKEEMETLVFSTRQIVQHVGVPGANLPGFSLPKGINAILPIFLQGLMHGTAEQRTQSALAMSDIIDRTSAEALKPFVTNLTGPLIRVVSERSVDLRCAILLTLNHLLQKIPLHLKPFLPQLQRTFAKSLADPTSDLLRSRAAKALGTLLTLKPRVDPLISELITGSKTTDAGVRNAMLQALYEVVSKAGDQMSGASRASILHLVDTDQPDNDDSSAPATTARLLGALTTTLPPAETAALIKQRALTTKHTYASALRLNAVLVENPQAINVALAHDVAAVIAAGIAHPSPLIAEHYVLAAAKFLLTPTTDATTAGPAFDTCRPVFDALGTACGPGGGAAIDTRRLALVAIRTLARRRREVVRPHVGQLAAAVFAGVRDAVIPVKLAAEAAFVALFDVVEAGAAVFERYMAGAAGEALAPQMKRAMQDYFKRVAMRLAALARERREAEGGEGGLGLTADEADDEREMWSVGKVDVGEGEVVI